MAVVNLIDPSRETRIVRTQFALRWQVRVSHSHRRAGKTTRLFIIELLHWDALLLVRSFDNHNIIQYVVITSSSTRFSHSCL